MEKRNQKLSTRFNLIFNLNLKKILNYENYLYLYLTYNINLNLYLMYFLVQKLYFGSVRIYLHFICMMINFSLHNLFIIFLTYIILQFSTYTYVNIYYL